MEILVKVSDDELDEMGVDTGGLWKIVVTDLYSTCNYNDIEAVIEVVNIDDAKRAIKTTKDKHLAIINHEYEGWVMSIDFSKAPNDATHYAVVFSADKPVAEWVRLVDGEFSNAAGCIDYSEYQCLLGNGIEIINLPTMVSCETEQELMLCEHVIRMLRDVPSQVLISGAWMDIDLSDSDDDNTVYISMGDEYRATPKKELVVPWEWLDLDVTAITVNDRGVVLAIDGSNQGFEIKLKLDLTDIDLPITVTRPKG